MKKMKFNKNNNSKNIKIIAASVLVVAVATAGSLYYIRSGVTPVDQDGQTIVVPGKDEMVSTIVMSKDVSSGDVILPSDYKVMEVSATEVHYSNVVGSFDLEGKVMRTNLSAGDMLSVDDLVDKPVYDENDRFVEHNFYDGAIPTTVKDGEMVGTLVDVMLLELGEEDKVVLSKKEVIARDGNKLAFYLDLNEMELIKEAANDGIFYITIYNGEEQEASKVTYVPKYDQIYNEGSGAFVE